MKFGLFFLPSSPQEGPSHDRLMQDWIEQIQYAEELGFDSVWLSEHCFSRPGVSPGGYGMPSPAVQAAYAAARTKRIRIGISVVVLPWHNPVHVAEDFAMVDIFSGGRLDFGIGRGNQAYEFGALGLPFHDTQERFDECLEVILKAWTSDSFSYDGKYYKYPDYDIWDKYKVHIRGMGFIPKPVQKPHPPIWQPVISPETMRKVARKRIQPILSNVFQPMEVIKKVQFEQWFDAVADAGRQRTEFYCPYVDWTYVAESEAAARREAEEHFMWYINKASYSWGGAKMPPQFKLYEGIAKTMQNLDWNEVYDNQRSVVGDPDRVIGHLKWFENLGMDYFIGLICFGGVKHELAIKSMKLFAEQVIPAFNRDTESRPIPPLELGLS